MKIARLSPEQLQSRIRERVEEGHKFLERLNGRFLLNEAAYTSKFYKEYDPRSGRLVDIVRKEKYKNMARVGSQYTYPFVKASHAKMLSVAPTVEIIPSTNSNDDKSAAKAARIFVDYARPQFKVQEKVSKTFLYSLLGGTAAIKVAWNSQLGKMVENENLLEKNEQGELVETPAIAEDEILMTGDIDLLPIQARNLIIDPNCEDANFAEWCAERAWLTKEEFKAFFGKEPPVKEDMGEAATSTPIKERVFNMPSLSSKKDLIPVWEYWEKKMPRNGLKGYHAFYCNGVIMEDPESNFEHPFEHGQLPYVFITDVDVPESPYGMTKIELSEGAQNTINAIDSRILDNINMHASIKLVVPKNASNNEGVLTNEVDVVYETGPNDTAPYQLQPASMPAYVFNMRLEKYREIQDIFSWRESSQGKIERELSGYAVNFAAEQDDKANLDMQIKVKNFYVNLYKLILETASEKYPDEIQLQVLGKENEYEFYRWSGASISSGWDIRPIHGTTLPLDGASRRQALTDLWDKKILNDPKQLLRLLELGDVQQAFDPSYKARIRQQEEIDIMIQQNVDIDVLENEDHEAHYGEVFDYMQSKDFYTLSPELQAHIIAHANAHKQSVVNRDIPDMPAMGAEMPPQGLPPQLPPLPQ